MMPMDYSSHSVLKGMHSTHAHRLPFSGKTGSKEELQGTETGYLLTNELEVNPKIISNQPLLKGRPVQPDTTVPAKTLRIPGHNNALSVPVSGGGQSSMKRKTGEGAFCLD